MTVIQAGWFSTTLTCTSRPSPAGTSRLPKSIRSWSGKSSSTSHGPPIPAVFGLASPGPGSGSPGLSSPGAGSGSPWPASSPSGSRRGWPESTRRRRNTVTHSPTCLFLAGLLAGRVPAHPPGACAGGLPGGVPAGGPEAATATCRPRQRLHFVQHHVRHPLDDQLGDPVAALEADGVVAIGVEQGDPDLATVPRVHGARRIDQRDAVPRGEPGPRMDERGVAVGQRDRDPGGNDGPLPGFQPHLSGREQVQPRVAGVSTGRQRQARVEPLDEHGDILLHGGEPYRCWDGCSGWSAEAAGGPGGRPRRYGPARTSATVIGTATTAPAMPAIAAPTASTRMMARGWIRTILPTTSGWRRWLSSWFSRMKIATSTSAATQPFVPRVTATASVPATRMPTSGTNAARKTRMTSGASSGTPMTHNATPMTTAWMAATAMVPRT